MTAPHAGSLEAALELGYVTRAHGLKGELAVRPLDAGSRTLERLSRVLLRERDGSVSERKVAGVRRAAKETLLVLEGTSTREGAERLKGAQVFALREDLGPLEEGQFFQGDLVGLAAVAEDGRPLGRVEAVWDFGPVPNLVIRTEAGEELAVPFADEFVPRVDLAAGRVIIRPPTFLE